MVSSYSLRAGLLDDLVALHTEASAEGEYEVSFHLLMAALKLAESLGDQDTLDRIAAVDDNRVRPYIDAALERLRAAAAR